MEVVDLLRNELRHGPDPFQVREDVPFALLVKDPLSVHENFHYTLSPGRDGDRGVWSESFEKLIRHPRGGAQMLSRYAVSDLQLNFSFHEVASQMY